MLDPDLTRPQVRPEGGVGDWTLAGYLAYGVALSMAVMGGGLILLTRRGGRATGRAR
jgi:hypothetical protein